METSFGTRIEDLTEAITRLADILEMGLGGGEKIAYTPAPVLTEMVDEKTMAKELNIPVRTLGKYRRQGKLPGCWLKNSKHIRWRVAQTLDTWKRGIA